MTFKNLFKERELGGDLLRQRRDFYAISLGLILFHLAGGMMKDTATLSTLPVKLAHPQVLYWSAWVSFAYFGWRYWVLDPGSWDRFREEWDRQSRASTEFRRLCERWLKVCDPTDQNAVAQATDLLAQYRPLFPAVKGDVPVELTQMWHLTSHRPEAVRPPLRTSVRPEDLGPLRRAKRRGFLRAILLERTATDLLLPYMMGAAAIIVSIITTLTGHSL